MNIQDIEHNVDVAVKLLKALSNEKRLRIIYALHSGEKSVGELEKLIDLSQSALSQHLARLRRDRLVQSRRQAQAIYYSLENLEVKEVLSCLHRLFKS